MSARSKAVTAFYLLALAAALTFTAWALGYFDTQSVGYLVRSLINFLLRQVFYTIL